MAKLSLFLPPFAADYSGAAGMLFGLDSLNVIVDASCCTRNYTMIDEPRWTKARKSTFGAQLRTLEATLGDDARLLDQTEQAADELGVSCIALIGTPVPALVGMDFDGMAWELEDRCGAPVIGVDTNGFDTYELGASRMQLQLVQRFAQGEDAGERSGAALGGDATGATGEIAASSYADSQGCEEVLSVDERKGFRETARCKANVLGATVQDYGSAATLDTLTNAVREQGCDLVWSTAGGYTLQDVEAAGAADESVICSWSGLAAARELKQRFGVPYRVGVPTAVLEVLPGAKELLASAADGSSPLLIVHDQVIANSLRDALRERGIRRLVCVASLFAMDDALMEPDDFRIQSETDLIDYAKANPDAEIAGDPVLRCLPIAGEACAGLFLTKRCPATYTQANGKARNQVVIPVRRVGLSENAEPQTESAKRAAKLKIAVNLGNGCAFSAAEHGRSSCFALRNLGHNVFSRADQTRFANHAHCPHLLASSPLIAD